MSHIAADALSSSQEAPNGANGSATYPLVRLLASTAEIDVDSLETSYAQRIEGMPCEATSNQFVVYAQLTDPKNAPLVDEAIKQGKEAGRTWEQIFCTITARLCKRIVPLIRQRVFVQVSPSGAADKESAIRWAHLYAEAFAAEGIDKSRYAIKIPTTGVGMCAAKELVERDGIQCLGTTMFNVPQAIAASQAGCYAVSPYFNEINAHGDHSLWPNVSDPLTQHPMANRMAQIINAYQSNPLRKHPQLKPASFLSWNEALACALLGADNLTILAPIFDEMFLHVDEEDEQVRAAKEMIKRGVSDEVRLKLLCEDPLSDGGMASIATFDTDFLADNGRALDAAIEVDAETKRRVIDSVLLFGKFLAQCRDFIEDKLKAL